MPKPETISKAPPEPPEEIVTEEAAVEAPAEIETSVEEFCRDLSRTDRRIELLSAFCAEEDREGRVKDVPSAFASRLAAFAVRPV